MLRGEIDPKEARMRIASLAATALISIGVLAAYAQSDDERYTLEKSPNGYVRMDKHTGEMSICQEQSGQLVCKLAADERSAFESEVDRLQGSVEALEKRVTALEADKKSYLPTDQDVDKSIDTMQRFLRGFFDIVKEFDEEQKTDPEALPQKT
jgi:hypothetical protein